MRSAKFVRGCVGGLEGERRIDPGQVARLNTFHANGALVPRRQDVSDTSERGLRQEMKEIMKDKLRTICRKCARKT